MALSSRFLNPSLQATAAANRELATLLFRPSLHSPAPPSRLRLSPYPFISPSFASLSLDHHLRPLPLIAPSATPESGGGGGDGVNDRTPPSGGGGDDDEDGEDKDKGDEDDDNAAGNRNVEEAMMVLAAAGRELGSLPLDLAAAIKEGRIPGSVVEKFLELEGSGGLIKWLLQFGGFKERLLADDLFLAKIGIECGVGMFTKTAAEYQKRKENFFKELEIVFADVVMAVIADFMLVYLPAPTVSLRPALALNAGRVAKFFHNCPDNAFQIALSGTSYSLFQRIGAIVRNGAKLFAVGTASSLVGTAVTNVLINARKAVENSGGEVEHVPIVSTSFAYGLYMSVSSNLRYQVLAGVIEQRMLEPFLHQHKLMLSAICFAIRTGNTFFGSLLWVDYARLIGLQKAPEEHTALE